MKIGYLMQEGVPDIRKKPLSGASNHVVSVIQEFKEAGHQVRLVVKFGKSIYWSDDLEVFNVVKNTRLDQGLVKFMERGIRRFQFDLKLPYANYFESLRFSSACTQVLPECDIFFERMGWLGYGGGLAAQKLQIPLIVEVNGDHLDEFRIQGLKVQKSQETLSYYLMKKAAARNAHIVATGEGWRQKYIERWDVSPDNVSVVENGSSLVDMLGREDLRSFQPVKPGEPMNVVYCGGFEPWHGIPIFVHAVYAALQYGCNLHITLIGSGSENSRITNLIQELGLEKYFTVVEPVAIRELAGYLAQADVGVSPYCGRVEYSGLKLLDYKAAGLATIASGKDDQPSVLKHQHTGWIVPPCDEAALTKAIIALAENVQLRTTIGRTARMEAEASHSWRHTVEQLLDIFYYVKGKRSNPDR